MMKKIIRVFSALSMLLLLMAANCNPEPEPTPPPTPTPDPPAVEASITLSISGTGPVTQTTDGNASAEFSADGGTASVPFSATVGWTASSSASWCSVSPTSGAKGSATITLTIAKNETYDERTATVTLKADNATRTISVKQLAAGGMLVSPKTISAPAEGGDYEIEVQHNVEFTVTVADASKDWISVVGTKGLMTDKVGIKVKANDDTSVREGTLTIKSTVGEATVTVTQSGKDVFVIEPTEVSLDAAGGTFEVKVTSTRGYHLSSKPDWVTQKSLKDDVFTFEAAENPETTERSGVIVICDDEGTCLPCSVKQAGAAPFFSISPEKVDMKAEGGTFTVTVTANHGYHLSSKPDWVTEKSFKDDVYTFEVSANEDVSERSGVVVICDDAGVCLPCSVTQAGVAPFFSITPEKVDMKAEGGTFTVTVTANHPYHLSSKPDWVTEKSFKDDVYTFEVAENKDITERSGVIVICDDAGVCLPCNVKQAGAAPFFSITPEKVDMEAEGGTFTVTVTANHSYHLSSTPDWVTQKSFKDNVYTFEVGFNSSDSERSGVIVVCDDKGICLSCTVKQEGVKPFSISPMQVNVGKDGGTFEVKVTSSYGYHLSGKPDWVTEKSVKDKVHTFEVGPSPTSDARSGAITFCDDKGTCLSMTVRQDGDPYIIDWNSEFYHNPLILSFICNGSYDYRKYRSAMEEAFSKMPKRPVLVNVHMWDDFELRDEGVLTERYSIGYPLVAIVDGRRRVNETYDKDYFISRIKESVKETEANYPVGSAIGFESSVSGQKLDVDVRLYFKLAGSYKVTVFVSESGVIAGQYDEEEAYIEKYRMDVFVRMVMTGSDGDAVSASALSTKKLHYSATIPSNVKKENLKITVAVQRAYGSQRKIVDSAYDYGDYYFDNCAAGVVGKAVPPALVNNAGGGNEDVTNGDPVNW